ncbi:fatty acid--CoA ligase family protein [Mangrovibacillus cuniculi]|uniref:Fatty acid--CoA ligase family protein n=1 Tax=Mangrovibacillus cuniculi TaxID=2593652 RepID=A0A7S8HF00_9BACI|nr:fatty acid--CoA ligase family protein [Mangrovibacillus cuniculi]QPC46011.1 fatty acid--CoA ligase family protein [Mangrovibacillus cuniculi]
MTISTRLQQVSSQYADKTAFEFMGKETTYRELEIGISTFAFQLEEMGIKKGDHVALLLGNSPHFIISLYGCLRVGATVIPVNPIYTLDEIQYILQNGDVKALIGLDLVRPMMQVFEKTVPSIEHFIVCETSPNQDPFTSKKMKSFTRLLSAIRPGYVGPVNELDDVAVILYTSGTTGQPKGAMLTHQNILSNAHDIGDYLSMSDQDRVITTLPMFHIFCLTVVLNAPLLRGATLLLLPKFSPKEVFEIARERKATIFAGVPTMYNFLFQYPEGKQEDFTSMRLCISGGASLPVALLENFEQKFDVQISEGYGLSEAAPVTCFNPIDRPRKPGSIGTSIMNVENKVVNELGEEVPVGEVGELIVRGPNVMKGYYKMPEETAVTIRDEWLYTGDMAKQDEEGYFYIVDRKKDMIIVGGYNVYPREVEEVLYRHPNVVEAAVIGVPHPELGEAVKCFVVGKDGLTKDEVMTHCEASLAKYKLPSSIEFINELPKNTTGKILRRALKEQLGVS